MIPVTQQDVEDRLRRELTDDELEALPGANAEASALVEGYLGLQYDPDDPEAPIPAAVVVTTSRVIARMYETATSALPAGVDSLSRGMGSLSASTHFVADATSGGPWLTTVDKTTLAPYRTGGVQCVPLARWSGR